MGPKDRISVDCANFITFRQNLRFINMVADNSRHGGM
jgi:hypothetical protein